MCIYINGLLFAWTCLPRLFRWSFTVRLKRHNFNYIHAPCEVRARCSAISGRRPQSWLAGVSPLPPQSCRRPGGRNKIQDVLQHVTAFQILSVLATCHRKTLGLSFQASEGDALAAQRLGSGDLFGETEWATPGVLALRLSITMLARTSRYWQGRSTVGRWLDRKLRAVGLWLRPSRRSWEPITRAPAAFRASSRMYWTGRALAKMNLSSGPEHPPNNPVCRIWHN